ncbi:MAG: hypothetical protein IPP77_05930 [Bacteroidetes bacterium]|nr:hypothetical protein [Bacteroidota bacterium]
MRAVTNQILLLPVLSGQRFCVVSAWRGEQSDEVNGTQHEDLRIRLKDLHLSIIELRCTYFYLNHGQPMGAEEKSFFVPKADLYEIMLIAEKYQQTSILYKREGRIEIVQVKVGRVLHTIPLREEYQTENFRTAYIHYVLSRNQNVGEITDINIAKLHLPTRLESLLRLKNKEDLSATEWMELF